MVIALFLYIARCRRTAEVQSRRPHRMRENRREVAGFQILTHENICVGQTLGWLGNYHTAGICSAIKWHFSDWALLGHRNKQRLPRTNGVCLLGSERASHTAIRGKTQLLGSTPTMRRLWGYRCEKSTKLSQDLGSHAVLGCTKRRARCETLL